MTIPNVAVGLRSGRVFVNATYSPGSGTYVDKDPVFQSASSDAEAIGNNVLKGLGEFTDGGELPDWKVYRSPVLDVANVKTWRDYEKGLKSCVVGQDGETLVIRGDHPAIALPRSAPPDAIGNAVLQVLGTDRERELKRTVAS